MAFTPQLKSDYDSRPFPGNWIRLKYIVTWYLWIKEMRSEIGIGSGLVNNCGHLCCKCRRKGGQCTPWSPVDWTCFQASAQLFSSDLQHSHDFLKMAETRTSLFVSSVETSSSRTANSGLMSIGVLEGDGKTNSFLSQIFIGYLQIHWALWSVWYIDAGAGQSPWKTNSTAKWFMFSTKGGLGQTVNTGNSHCGQTADALQELQTRYTQRSVQSEKTSLKLECARQYCFSEMVYLLSYDLDTKEPRRKSFRLLERKKFIHLIPQQ